MENKKFNNGLSVMQLEERFEMVAAAEASRDRRTTVTTTVEVKP